MFEGFNFDLIYHEQNDLIPLVIMMEGTEKLPLLVQGGINKRKANLIFSRIMIGFASDANPKGQCETPAFDFIFKDKLDKKSLFLQRIYLTLNLLSFPLPVIGPFLRNPKNSTMSPMPFFGTMLVVEPFRDTNMIREM